MPENGYIQGDIILRDLFRNEGAAVAGSKAVVSVGMVAC